jgi:nicotinamidase-related amidase
MSETKALMVIDVQCVYMEPEPMVTSDGDDLIDKCNGLIEKARAAGVPVVYVQHRSEDRPDDPELIGVHPELAPRAGEPVIQKRFGSAFIKTDLEETLRDLGAETLYICGLATFGCVNATVMCSVCEGYETIVVKDVHGAQDFPDSTVAQVIDHFNSARGRAGARLISASEVSF